MQRRLPNIIEERDKFNYKGIGGRASFCRVRLFNSETTGCVVAVVTELAANTGSSVTNSVENLAAQLVADFQLDPERFVMVEHYPEEEHSGSTFEDGYSTVNLSYEGRRGFKRQGWSPLPVEELARLTGTPIEEFQPQGVAV